MDTQPDQPAAFDEPLTYNRNPTPLTSTQWCDWIPAYPEPSQTPLGTFAASAVGSLSSTAVLESGPTEILPSVVAISKYPARLCRPRRHNSRAHPREPRGSRPTTATSPRETDSPLEGDGFELSVPRERGHRFELSLLFMSLKPS